MWLINTKSLELELVLEPLRGSYAILSHTWEDGEVSYQEFRDLSRARSKKGFAKILRTCQLAAKRGVKYAWVDTCCIDKLSSSELSEAINSMFKWYMDSAFCVVFLSDLPQRSAFEKYFPRCRWLTRGWTLQELIAPPTVEFYDEAWQFRGQKSELKPFLARVTGIEEAVLGDNENTFQVPIARRMSWASARTTTRTEDMAYCLMGIFNVNMPMIYGEGPKAFMRLQEEIARESCDLSLFAWKAEKPSTKFSEKGSNASQEYRGIFARSPREFASCRNLQLRIKDATLDKEFTVTNRGLRIETALVNAPSVSHDLIWNLGVSEIGDWPKYSAEGWMGVYLAKTVSGYVRAKPYELYTSRPDDKRLRCKTSLMHIRKDLHISQARSVQGRFRGAVSVNIPKAECEILTVAPEYLWDRNRKIFLNSGQGINAYLLLKVPPRPGFDSGFPVLVACSTMDEPVCAIWSKDSGLWDSVVDFMNNAKEAADYVAADYFRMHFIDSDRPAPSSTASITLDNYASNLALTVQVQLRPSSFEGQEGYSLDLQVSTKASVRRRGSFYSYRTTINSR